MATLKAGYSLVKVRLLDSEDQQPLYYQAYKNRYLAVGSEYACTYNGVKDTRVVVVEMDIDPAVIADKGGKINTLFFPKEERQSERQRSICGGQEKITMRQKMYSICIATR